MTRRRRARGTSAPRELVPGRYAVTPSDIVVVLRPTQTEVDIAQRIWAPLRDPAAPETHWDWRDIMPRYSERGAVVAIANDEILAMWAGRLDVERTAGGRTFVLEFLEVHPRLRGHGRWGPLALAIICARALAVGRSSIALAAFQERVAWYIRAGAVRDPGLMAEEGLVTLRIDEEWVQSHARMLDGIREKEEGT